MTHTHGYLPEPGQRAVRMLCALLIPLAFVLAPHLQAGEASPSFDARLRLDWDSADAEFWKVRLSVTDAAADVECISEVDNHSESDRTTGALELSGDARTLTFQPRHALPGGAVQFRIRGSRDARLSLAVVSSKGDVSAKTPTLVKEVSLAELMQQGAMSSEDQGLGAVAGKPSWTLSRIANDELRIEDLRDVPVYRPDEQLSFTVRANAMLGHASRQLTLQYSLYRISNGESASLHRRPITIDAYGNSESITINESVPTLPGVYEIRCQLAEDDDNIWSRLRRRGPPTVRVGRPIVVVSQRPSSPETSSQPTWSSVGEIRPSESSWSVGQWLPKPATRFIPGSSSSSVDPQSATELASQRYAGESISLIPPEKTFQATLPVAQPGLPHKVTIRYPAARSTKMRVDVATADGRANPATSFVLASDPDLDHPDGWKTYSFVHYPTSDDQIWLTNLDTSRGATFESVSVLAGPRHLMPESTRGADRTSQPRTAALRLVDMAWVESLSTDLNDAPTLAQCDPKTVALSRLWVASDRLRDYALASGINGLVVPAGVGGQTWFASDTFFPRRDQPEHHSNRLATLLALLQQSDLRVFVGLDPDMLLSGVEQTIRRQPTLAAELIRSRVAGSEMDRSDQYNLLHPLVQTNLASLVAELDRQCSEYKCFAGIVMQCDAGSHTAPLREVSDDPDVGTLTLFGRSKSAQTALNELRNWVQERGKRSFETWLRDETRGAYTRLGQSASSRVLVMVMAPISPTGNDADELHDQPFTHGWPIDGVTVVPAQHFCYGPHHLLGKKSLLQQQLASSMATASGDAATSQLSRIAILGNQVHPTAEEPALVRDRMIADVSRIIDRVDPSILMIELPTEARRLRDELSRSLRAFSAMPAENMRPVNPADPASQTLHVSVGTKDGYSYVSVISLVPWTSDVQFESFTPIDWVQVGQADPSEEPTLRQTTGTRASVAVPAGQMVVLKSKTPTNGAAIQSWSSRVTGGDEALERIKRNVTLIVERGGILSDFETYDSLTNGGFEQAGGMGLVGWLHAQHPPGCVRIDDKEFVEGKHSVLLTTDPATATRTWIVSETVEPPRSGRLAVSLACRSELRKGDSVHRLRVSIEATRDRKPIRFTSEFDVPRNGQWGSREVVLEADGIDVATVDSLRLTIDSLSGGRVWIDDVRLHDQFPTAKERAEVKSQAFLAVRGLQQGNLTPSGRLLQNHWARHLLALDPAPQPRRVIKMEEPVDETPGVADRIRSWLPRPLRF